MISAKVFKGGMSNGSLEPGIYEGCTFESIVVENGWLDITFTVNGRNMRKRIFDPAGKYPNDGETIQAAIDREVATNAAQLTHVMQAIVSEEEINKVEGKDYASFVAAVAKALKGKNGALVNVKLVFDKAGEYVEFPRRNAWIEKHVNGEPAKLKISQKELQPGESKKKVAKEVDGDDKLPF